jgi:fluoride exporter
MRIALWVALGSGIGGVCRIGMVEAMSSLCGASFPYGVLASNIAGSMAVGLLAALAAPGGGLLMSPAARHFFISGFCGGFTTFSVFSLQTMQLIKAGRIDTAGFYAFCTISLSLVAVILGHQAGAKLNKSRGRSSC